MARGALCAAGVEGGGADGVAGWVGADDVVSAGATERTPRCSSARVRGDRPVVVVLGEVEGERKREDRERLLLQCYCCYRGWRIDHLYRGDGEECLVHGEKRGIEGIC
jgi:hypothetical protein